MCLWVGISALWPFLRTQKLVAKQTAAAISCSSWKVQWDGVSTAELRNRSDHIIADTPVVAVRALGSPLCIWALTVMIVRQSFGLIIGACGLAAHLAYEPLNIFCCGNFTKLLHLRSWLECVVVLSLPPSRKQGRLLNVAKVLTTLICLVTCL